jgi:hypothetical protein
LYMMGNIFPVCAASVLVITDSIWSNVGNWFRTLLMLVVSLSHWLNLRLKYLSCLAKWFRWISKFIAVWFVLSIFLLKRSSLVKHWVLPVSCTCADYATINITNPLPGWQYNQLLYLNRYHPSKATFGDLRWDIYVIPHLVEILWSLILVQHILFFI